MLGVEYAPGGYSVPPQLSVGAGPGAPEVRER